MLVLETGEGLSNSNAYASVAEGTEYAAGHLYASVWTDADNAHREAALRMATRAVDAAVAWKGARKTSTQALGWPRIYALSYVNYAAYPPQYIYYDDASVPKGVKDAVCELAIGLLTADRTGDAPGKGIKSFGIGQGAIDVTFDPQDARELLNEVTNLLLRPFGEIISGKGVRFIRVLRA